jgi:hypothetical protein
MRTRDVWVALVGGSVIYVAMAACSASKDEITWGGHGGQGGTGQSVAASGKGSGILDPVPEASADPVNGSRLKAKYRTAEDGAKEYLPYFWYDSERQTDCAFGPSADGKERCIPSPASSAGVYFADPSCAQPLAHGLACTYPPPKYATSYDGATCPATSRIYVLGTTTSPAKIYAKSGASCVDLGAPSPAFSYYELGAEVPPASFVAGTVQHD